MTFDKMGNIMVCELSILRTVTHDSPAREGHPTSLFAAQRWPPPPPIPSPTCWAALGHQSSPKHPHMARLGTAGPAGPPF